MSLLEKLRGHFATMDAEWTAAENGAVASWTFEGARHVLFVVPRALTAADVVDAHLAGLPREARVTLAHEGAPTDVARRTARRMGIELLDGGALLQPVAAVVVPVEPPTQPEVLQDAAPVFETGIEAPSLDTLAVPEPAAVVPEFDVETPSFLSTPESEATYADVELPMAFVPEVEAAAFDAAFESVATPPEAPVAEPEIDVVSIPEVAYAEAAFDVVALLPDPVLAAPPAAAHVVATPTYLDAAFEVAALMPEPVIVAPRIAPALQPEATYAEAALDVASFLPEPIVEEPIALDAMLAGAVDIAEVALSVPVPETVKTLDGDTPMPWARFDLPPDVEACNVSEKELSTMPWNAPADDEPEFEMLPAGRSPPRSIEHPTNMQAPTWGLPWPRKQAPMDALSRADPRIWRQKERMEAIQADIAATGAPSFGAVNTRPTELPKPATPPWLNRASVERS